MRVFFSLPAKKKYCQQHNIDENETNEIVYIYFTAKSTAWTWISMSQSVQQDEEWLPDTQGIESQEVRNESTMQSGMEKRPWARLFSLEESFSSLDMEQDVYAFGRSSTCDVIYSDDRIMSDVLLSLSKLHFKIIRRLDHSSMTRIVELHDFSFNGTFINGELVGRGHKKILDNEDEVALATPVRKVYIYINSNPAARDGVTLPTAVTDKYVVSRLLGSGTFGVVHLVFNKVQKTKYAMKTIIKERVHASLDTNGKQKYDEAKVLEILHHPCIIDIFENIDTEHSVHLILEFMEGGDLLKRLMQVNKFPELQAKFIFHQLVLAVQYLHSRGISHRDLKMDNILLATNSDYPLVKLADFGLSRIVGDNLMVTFCGTPEYLAPEILRAGGFRGYTSKVDIWSLGVILYLCLSGKQPFNKHDKRQPLQEQILRGFYVFSDPLWSSVSQAAKSLIKRMMVVNPLKRLDIEEVIKQPWLQDQKIRKKVSELLQMHAKRSAGSSFEENLAPNKRLCAIDEAP